VNIKGKSAITAEIAKQFNLKLIDLRLSQMEPTDLNAV
jgi:shikimate kinase